VTVVPDFQRQDLVSRRGVRAYAQWAPSVLLLLLLTVAYQYIINRIDVQFMFNEWKVSQDH
jgi:hypothetical protein